MIIIKLSLLLYYISTVVADLKPVRGSVQVGKIKMSPIGGGTWAWGNQLLWGYSKDDDVELQRTFDFVVSKGMNWFDTADSYGTGALSGRSEKLLGDFWSRQSSSKRNVNFCTKIAPFPWRIGKQKMTECFRSSKQRLRRPVTDMVQLHWPPTLGWQETSYLQAFCDLVQAGEAGQIGLSNYGPVGLKRAINIVERRDLNVYSNQVQFSLMSRQPLQSGLADTCAELGIQPISYSPLALGLLTDKYTLDRLPKGPRGILFREYLPVMQGLLNEMREIAKLRKKTVAQVALNWNLQKGFLVLVGIRTVEQAKDIMGASNWALSAAEVEALDTAANKVPKSLIQNPNQGL